MIKTNLEQVTYKLTCFRHKTETHFFRKNFINSHKSKSLSCFVNIFSAPPRPPNTLLHSATPPPHYCLLAMQLGGELRNLLFNFVKMVNAFAARPFAFN